MDNLRGIGLMVLAMLAFATTDALIKAAAADIPLGQILFTMGLGGATVFAGVARLRGLTVWSRAFFHPAVIVRNISEIIGTLGFVTALTLIPLSTATAILQATPLMVTLGAALFLGETIGRRRWSAIAIGLAGVLIILRPGMAVFDSAALLAVIGMFGLSGRDLATRAVPRDIHAIVLSAYGFAMMMPMAAVIYLMRPDQALVPVASTGILLVILTTAVIGYYAITAAMRTGEVGAVAPFRYSRLIFGLAIGMVFFKEQLDVWTILGSLIVVGSGLYTFAREQALAISHAALSPPPKAR